jgi:succinoglycan biosynthesis protein ExoO
MSSISESYTGDGAENRPLISVVMANYRGALYLADAIESVLKQSVTNIELIVSDDASPDNSVKIVEDIMLRDKRVKLLTADNNSGPARARNRALSAARGQWIAIVDSDDLLHPKRFEWLLRAASHYNAVIVADDLLHFSTENCSEISYLLNEPIFSTPFEITVGNFMSGNDSQMPAFGYLKPMFHSTILQGVQYDEALKIGEDYDLVLRLLFNGAKYIIIPQPFYLYRRHPNSISYRLSETAVEAMIENSSKLHAKYGQLDTKIDEAFRSQLKSLYRALEFERFVAAVKHLRIKGAFASILKHPSFVIPLGTILSTRITKGFHKIRERLIEKKATQDIGKTITFLRGKNSGPEQLSQALTYSELKMLSLHIENISPITNPENAWTESQAQNKDQWKQLATLAQNTETLLYHGPEGEFVAGFIPKTIKHIDLSDKFSISNETTDGSVE